MFVTGGCFLNDFCFYIYRERKKYLLYDVMFYLFHYNIPNLLWLTLLLFLSRFVLRGASTGCLLSV